MSKKTFAVDISKQQLTFSCAHFITFAGNICEALHGHNYGVSCRVEGQLDVNQYVIDFIALRDQLAEISKHLDHHVILPTKHPSISVQHDATAKEVVTRFEDKRWIFPEDDCILLPVANTTAEEIASYFVDHLCDKLGKHISPLIKSLTVRIDENQGQWGECRLDF